MNPATAAYPGMPSAAIATGAVDRVLDLSEIAPAIHAIVTGSESVPA
jgi:chemotaxis response regulator CheB